MTEHDSMHDPSWPSPSSARTKQAGSAASSFRTLTIRCCSGLSGDMILTGFSRLLDLDDKALNALAAGIMPELDGCLSIGPAQVHGIGGFRAAVTLPYQHAHRTLADILAIIGKAELTPRARELAEGTFVLLAKAEASVHGKSPDEIHFHEVGALDSVLDIVLSCVLFDLAAPALFRVSPLPMADGSVVCAHGVLPVPAPAVLELLDGVPVTPFPGQGETVTPTALALLKSLNASFGPWPAMLVERHCLAYGSRVFPNAPNGAIFALGHALQS